MTNLKKYYTIKGETDEKRKGSLNGKKGIFEWIHDSSVGVTHRRFIPNGKITGIPTAH